MALLLLGAAFNTQAAAQTPEVYKDAGAPVEARVADLLGRMTVEEKITLIAGSTYMYTHAIPRLGIPRLRMSDGPVGVREQEANGAPTLPSTVYAGGLGLAASWDLELARRVGASIGRDCRARDVNILLGPGMDMYRDPVGGRNFEYYGEDPLVTGLIAAAYIKGVQSQGVAATMKHFVGKRPGVRPGPHQLRRGRTDAAGNLSQAVRDRRENERGLVRDEFIQPDQRGHSDGE